MYRYLKRLNNLNNRYTLRFEVQMILKIVRYLGQQGYGTDNLVILTPYLGQLRAIMDALNKDNDPVLNDLDSYDLVRAGLMSGSAAKSSKKQIRIATIGTWVSLKPSWTD